MFYIKIVEFLTVYTRNEKHNITDLERNVMNYQLTYKDQRFNVNMTSNI